MDKLLFFASDFKIGLSSLLTDELIAFNQSNLDILAIAGEGEQEHGLSDKLCANKIHISRINGLDQHSNFRKLTCQIARLIEEEEIKFIHVQNNWQLAIISYIKYIKLKDHKLKVIYTLHAFRHNSPIKSVLARFIIGITLLFFVDRVICMSTYLTKRFWFIRYKIAEIPLGINDDYFIKERIKGPSNGLQMIFPAQFRHGKNHKLIIKAFAEHIKKENDEESKIIFPGKGPLEADLRELSNSLGLKDRVIFEGFCTKNKIKELYLQSNIGIVASNSETFGQSIVEPFVLGRCVLTTHVGIADDIIKEGVNGFFFNSKRSLVNLFGTLYHRQEVIESIGRKNFEKRYLFSWKKITYRYVTMLQNIK